MIKSVQKLSCLASINFLTFVNFEQEKGKFKVNLNLFLNFDTILIVWYIALRMKKLLPYILFVTLFSAILLPIVIPFKVYATTAPEITVSTENNNSEKISITFESDIPKADITDIEVYDLNNNRVHQYFSDNGGKDFSTTTPQLPNGTYKISVGLFTPNWLSNYNWFDKISTFGIGTTVSPTVSPQATPAAALIQNSALRNTALNAYKEWKDKFVINDGNGALRVIRPENNNDTVSEGIGYGMLLAVYADDEPTFSGLLNYAKKHYDQKGLMNWNINDSGSTIGQGSAADADADMAYAMTLASDKWQGKSYTNDSKNMIQAIMKNEVTDKNLLNPGDNWGATKTVNPSYLSPSYYIAFGKISGDNRWTDVYNSTLKWLSQVSNPSTGLVPDWSSADFSDPDVNFDKYKNSFYYDALRTPIRLLHTVKMNNDSTATSLLNKQNSFFRSLGIDKLKSGYTLDGKALTDYLDTAFLSAYAAAGQIDSNSDYSKKVMEKLVNDTKPSYFGSTLRALTLMFASL